MAIAHTEAANEARMMQTRNAMKYRPVVDITAYALRTQGFANVEFYLMKKSKETTDLENIRMDLIYAVWEEIAQYCFGDKVELDMITGSDPSQIVKLHLSEKLLVDEFGSFSSSICKHCYKIRPCHNNCDKKKMQGRLTSSKEQKEIEMENEKKRRMDELATANRKAKAGPPPGF